MSEEIGRARQYGRHNCEIDIGLPTLPALASRFAAGHADHPGRIYCGTIPGGLFRSDDRGDSWQIEANLWNHPLRKEYPHHGIEPDRLYREWDAARRQQAEESAK